MNLWDEVDCQAGVAHEVVQFNLFDEGILFWLHTRQVRCAEVRRECAPDKTQEERIKGEARRGIMAEGGCGLASVSASNSALPVSSFSLSLSLAVSSPVRGFFAAVFAGARSFLYAARCECSEH